MIIVGGSVSNKVIKQAFLALVVGSERVSIMVKVIAGVGEDACTMRKDACDTK